jgi:hypothetical protein
MTRVVRNAALFAVAGALVASAAMANVPDPAHSSLQGSFFAVEGSSAGQPDNCSDGRCGNWTITVRDFGNNVIAGSTVVIDFSSCSDIQIACDQLNSVTGQSYLAGKKVAGTTSALGTFTFKVQGAGPTGVTPAAAGTNAGTPCAQVYADGVPMGSLVVASYDINAIGSPTAAVNAADVSELVAEALSPLQDRARADYNGTGTVNAGDTAISSGMALQQAAGTGSKLTSPYCP